MIFYNASKYKFHRVRAVKSKDCQRNDANLIDGSRWMVNLSCSFYRLIWLVSQYCQCHYLHLNLDLNGIIVYPPIDLSSYWPVKSRSYPILVN